MPPNAPASFAFAFKSKPIFDVISEAEPLNETDAPLDIVPLPAFQDNYIWLLRKGEYAAVVDPGDAEPVLRYLQQERLQLAAILNTHHHHDHVGGNARLLKSYSVPVFGPQREPIAALTDGLIDNDSIALPELALRFTVLAIPGHTAGHIAYFGANTLFCGDTLFAGGCGRLFEGTPAQMLSSLTRLAELPDDTAVYCGHEYTLANLRFARSADPDNIDLAVRQEHAKSLREQGLPTLPSTIALEKATNPFLRCNERAVISASSVFAGRTLTDPIAVFAALRQWKDQF